MCKSVVVCQPCECCGEREGTLNSGYWKVNDGTYDGHWVCVGCEIDLAVEYDNYCPCGCRGPEDCVYSGKALS